MEQNDVLVINTKMSKILQLSYENYLPYWFVTDFGNAESTGVLTGMASSRSCIAAKQQM